MKKTINTNSERYGESQRTERAATILGKSPEYQGDPRSALVDLLTDLQHWAEANAVHFELALITARYHYDEERTE